MKKFLTKKETQIIELMSLGCDNNSIGQTLNIAVNTVKNHNKNIFKKLNVKNRKMVAYCYLNAIKNIDSINV